MVGMRKISFSLSEERPFLDLAIPDVPQDGVRIRVCYAGLCYVPGLNASPFRKGSSGFRNGNVFDGFEISGVIESMGSQVVAHDLSVGDAVTVFPDEEITQQGYADFLIVRKLNNIVKLPASISLAVGALLPTGGTLAMSAVIHSQKQLERLVAINGHCNILIFGAGSLTHWLVRLLRYSSSRLKDKIHIIVASDDWEGLKIAQQLGAEEVVLLDERKHEERLIEKLQAILAKSIEMSVCLTHEERSQKRAVRCLSRDGVLVIPEFSMAAESEVVAEKNLEVVEVPRGDVNILRTLVRIIDQGGSLQKNQPAYKVYPMESAEKIYAEVELDEIKGRPILDFEALENVF